MQMLEQRPCNSREAQPTLHVLPLSSDEADVMCDGEKQRATALYGKRREKKGQRVR